MRSGPTTLTCSSSPASARPRSSARARRSTRGAGDRPPRPARSRPRSRSADRHARALDHRRSAPATRSSLGLRHGIALHGSSAAVAEIEIDRRRWPVVRPRDRLRRPRVRLAPMRRSGSNSAEFGRRRAGRRRADGCGAADGAHRGPTGRARTATSAAVRPVAARTAARPASRSAALGRSDGSPCGRRCRRRTRSVARAEAPRVERPRCAALALRCCSDRARRARDLARPSRRDSRGPGGEIDAAPARPRAARRAGVL